MFQSTVNVDPAIGVAGDFASNNPRSNVLGSFVAGVGGVIVGHFAWLDNNGNAVSTGTGPVTGFVHRELTATIVNYLAEYSMTILQGSAVTLFAAGDFLAKNDGAAAATVGMAVFAKLSDGSVAFAASGATVAGYIETKWQAASAGAVGELVKINSVHLG